MDLKQEFLAALESDMKHEYLLDLVRRHQGQGLTRDQSYQALEEIWLEHGFNDSVEESPMRNNLEYVMEKIWYQGTDAA
jgi:hypothetical protein